MFSDKDSFVTNKKIMKTLKNILLINALSSGATGLGLIVFASFLAPLFGVSVLEPFWIMGLFLVLFAGIVFYQSGRNPISPKGVTFIITLDILWVITSFVIVIFQLYDLSILGYILIGAVALWVAGMAFFQAKGLKQLTV